MQGPTHAVCKPVILECLDVFGVDYGTGSQVWQPSGVEESLPRITYAGYRGLSTCQSTDQSARNMDMGVGLTREVWLWRRYPELPPGQSTVDETATTTQPPSTAVPPSSALAETPPLNIVSCVGGAENGPVVLTVSPKCLAMVCRRRMSGAGRSRGSVRNGRRRSCRRRIGPMCAVGGQRAATGSEWPAAGGRTAARGPEETEEPVGRAAGGGRQTSVRRAQARFGGSRKDNSRQHRYFGREGREGRAQ